jgi:predicted ATPase
LPLIGREADLEVVGKRLADPDVRLVTLLGPGGVGKTSLALAAGDRFAADFADGAVFVSLGTAKEPTDIVPSIASALGLDEQAPASAVAQVAEYLRRLELLLILDNFEHVVAGANHIAELLAAAPRVVALVTTRQRLNLAVEWVYELPGLAFPDENSAMPLAQFGAMQLFARRAQQERGDFALLSAEAVAAAEICRLTQGMPLAIELAAAATSLQPTAEIARQLRHGLDALAADWSDVPPRHRSVRAAFEHS